MNTPDNCYLDKGHDATRAALAEAQRERDGFRGALERFMEATEHPYTKETPEGHIAYEAIQRARTYARRALAAPPSTAATPEHWVSASCGGEVCGCGAPATHKMGEEIMHDDPNPYRHNLTAYVCCACFRRVVGDAVWHTAATPEER